MGQYKVPQNVEAEDHILGPLTFKQFIYAMIGVGWAIASFALFKSVPALLIVVGFPPTMMFLLLAFYTKDGQNFEQILLAIVQFFAASRRRLWVKEDIEESFHINKTPHKAEQTQRDPEQVRSQLEKLATLIDSRGWNAQPIMGYGQQQNPAAQFTNTAALPSTDHSERIVAPTPPPAPHEDHHDMLDMQNSPLAQDLAQMLQAAANDVKAQAVQQMTTGVAPGGRPMVPQMAQMPQMPQQMAPQMAQMPQPIPQMPQMAQLAPASVYTQAPAPISTSVTQAHPDDILKLATQSSELTVSQLAAQATRLTPPQPLAPGVEVNLRGR